ncbi:MAG: SMC-Scp complex subunit ScpB, partial [Planctomycetota bacterium]
AYDPPTMNDPSRPGGARPKTTDESSERVGGRFTVSRLSSAFARLMSATSVTDALRTDGPSEGTRAQRPDMAQTQRLGAELEESRVSPQMIVEGMLFVGRADGQPLTSTEMAAHIRGVEATEIESLVNELNQSYRERGAAYRIERNGPGFRLRVRDDLDRLRERFRGRVKAAKLSPSALEVLSLVAYRQPVTGETINRVRGARSHAILNQLVRRELVRFENRTSSGDAAQYRTTERFNRLFGIQSPADLPRSEDLDDH